MAEKEILTLDLKPWNMGQGKKPKFATLEAAKPIEDLKTRIKALMAGQDKAGEFYRQFHYQSFHLYISSHS